MKTTKTATKMTGRFPLVIGNREKLVHRLRQAFEYTAPNDFIEEIVDVIGQVMEYHSDQATLIKRRKK